MQKTGGYIKDAYSGWIIGDFWGDLQDAGSLALDVLNDAAIGIEQFTDEQQAEICFKARALSDALIAARKSSAISQGVH